MFALTMCTNLGKNSFSKSFSLLHCVAVSFTLPVDQLHRHRKITPTPAPSAPMNLTVGHTEVIINEDRPAAVVLDDKALAELLTHLNLPSASTASNVNKRQAPSLDILDKLRDKIASAHTAVVPISQSGLEERSIGNRDDDVPNSEDKGKRMNGLGKRGIRRDPSKSYAEFMYHGRMEAPLGSAAEER